MLWTPRGPDVVRFTRNAADGTAPLWNSTGNDDQYWWQGPGGTFIGKQPHIGNFPIGDYTARSSAWELISQFDFAGRRLTKLDADAVLPHMRGLTRLRWNTNLFSADLLDVWRKVPRNGVFLLIQLQAMQAPGVVSGDVSNIIFSQIPTFNYLDVSSTACTYGTGGGFATINNVAATGYYILTSCGLALEAVDRALADCVASNRSTQTLSIAGTNAAPTDGANNANRLELVNNRGWTVTVTA